MRLKTVLNRIEKYKSFVYETARWVEDSDEAHIEIDVKARANSRPVCSGCEQPFSIYDHQPEPRKFEYVPLWGIVVLLVYTMRRVNCPRCGVKVEQVPWADGKSRQTRSMKIFLATWARRMPWQAVATVFQTNWSRVRDAVSWVVAYGMEHRDLSDITAIGVDEMHFGKGLKYLTLVYQINDGMKRLLYVGKNRTENCLRRFFFEFGEVRAAKLKYICTDMWKPYLNVIQEHAKGALHILDRFHIVGQLNKALNKIRAQEARQLRGAGYEEVLKGSRYCFLKNEENLTPKQEAKLKDVLEYDLKSVRAYLLKESFQGFWKYTSPHWAEWFLDKWCARAMRSRLDPIKKFVKSIRGHKGLILNWFKAKKQFSSGVVEGLNRKVNLITRKSFGFREYSTLETALFHELGKLPEPPVTHRFC